MRCLSAVIVVLMLTACASTPQSRYLLHPDGRTQFEDPTELAAVPFFPQEDYQCGPAALATILSASGVSVTPEELVTRVYVPARQGSLQAEMFAAGRAYGRISYLLDPSLTSVLKEVKQGRPVLIMQNLGISWYPRWHYAVVVGYDIRQNELILRSGKTKNYRMSLPLFERTWQRSKYWAMVVLDPGELPVDPNELRYFEAVAALEYGLAGSDVEPAYRAGLQKWPASQMLAMGLGNLLYAQGNKVQSAQVFSALIDQDPHFAPAHNNLAQVMLELGNHEIAIKHAKAAVQLGGKHHRAYQETLDAIPIQ